MSGLATCRWRCDGVVVNEVNVLIENDMVSSIGSNRLRLGDTGYTCEFEFDPALQIPPAPLAPEDEVAILGVVRIYFEEVDGKPKEEIASLVADRINRAAEGLLSQIVDRGTHT